MKRSSWYLILISNLLFGGLCYSHSIKHNINDHHPPERYLKSTERMTSKFHRADLFSEKLNTVICDSLRRMLHEKRGADLLQFLKQSVQEITPSSFTVPPKRTSPITSHIVTDTIQPAWVRHYGSGLSPSLEISTDIKVDATGNVYMVGLGTNSSFESDLLIIKYDANGNEAWHSRYDPGPLEEAGALQVYIDSVGNVYAAGIAGTSGHYDYLTLKYNENGELLWSARYNGLGNQDDQLSAIAVDGSGNVFVTGRSVGLGTSDDYATVKYDPSGNELWVVRYDGFLNSDKAVDIALDKHGNIYVTGSSYDSSYYQHNDFVTIKYDSNGIEQWQTRYNGYGSSYDVAVNIALDDSGYIYVAGNCSDSSNYYYNYAVVKYNSLGMFEWTTHYNGPDSLNNQVVAMVLDKTANVYVTGTSERKYATVKYNVEGQFQWEALYESAAYQGCEAVDLTLDPSGNIFVTGTIWSSDTTSWDFATVKYNSSGIEQWVAMYDGPEGYMMAELAAGIGIDSYGNIYVSGGSAFDIATVKYANSGAEQWVRRWGDIGSSNDYAVALAVDSSGNSYVTGYSAEGLYSCDILTTSYDPLGNQRWLARYNSGTNTFDMPTAIAVDLAGNVCVTGSSTIKYNSSGSQQWVNAFSGVYGECANSLTIDGEGNVYVAGSDFLLIKHYPNGSEQWRITHDYEGDKEANYVMTDDSGSVYVVGATTGGLVTTCIADSCWCDFPLDECCNWICHTNDNSVILIAKYNSLGQEQWSAAYGIDNEMSDVPVGLGIDASGHVYVMGCSYNGDPNFDMDYLAIKYTNSGESLWVARDRYYASYHFQARAGAVDPFGNVYVTGWCTVKFDSNGNLQWSVNNNLNIYGATDITIDRSGNICTIGQAYVDGDVSIVTGNYNTDGNALWRANFNAEAIADAYDDPCAVAVDGSNNVYVAGNSTYGIIGNVYSLVKYEQPMVGVVEDRAIFPNKFLLSQNYPNPFNPSTTIRFELPKESFVTMKVYNVLGQEVTTLVNEKREAGRYEVEYNASGLTSGVYFYRLQAGKFIETNKLMLLR